FVVELLALAEPLPWPSRSAGWRFHPQEKGVDTTQRAANENRCLAVRECQSRSALPTKNGEAMSADDDGSRSLRGPNWRPGANTPLSQSLGDGQADIERLVGPDGFRHQSAVTILDQPCCGVQANADIDHFRRGNLPVVVE